VFVHRRPGFLGRGYQALAVVRPQPVGGRQDQLVDDRQRAAILSRIGLRMDFRHGFGNQRLAHLCEKARQLLHARGGGDQPLLDGREIARHQAIERAAAGVGVDQRVPAPVLVHIQREGFRLQRLGQHGGVDLIVERELRVVDGLQRVCGFLDDAGARGAARLADVIEFGVVPVLAGYGCGGGAVLEDGVHPGFRQPREIDVGFRRSGLRRGLAVRRTADQRRQRRRRGKRNRTAT
jgi:hypothetical protein